MSKVNIEFDTVTDALSVKVDGEELQNVCSVNIYTTYWYYNGDGGGNEDDVPPIHIEICQHEMPDEKEGLHKHIRLTASENDEQKIKYSVKAQKNEKIVADIHKFLKSVK